MKFSIIVPVYNTEKFVGDCIDSVLNQTYDDFELVLVDDGSTDKSNINRYIQVSALRSYR
jgi:glycosyltransferase involved in cell wall biosynthesis